MSAPPPRSKHDNAVDEEKNSKRFILYEKLRNLHMPKNKKNFLNFSPNYTKLYQLI
jgi:hypothetical protein